MQNVLEAMTGRRGFEYYALIKKQVSRLAYGKAVLLCCVKCQ